MIALTAGIRLVSLAMAAGEPGKEILYPVVRHFTVFGLVATSNGNGYIYEVLLCGADNMKSGGNCLRFVRPSMRAFILALGGFATAFQAAQSQRAPEPPPATFFVATDGNDAWSGTLAAPNVEATDGPFATLTRARDALRAVDRKQQKSPLMVMVHGGKYFLDDTFVIGPKDGGTAERAGGLYGLSGREADLERRAKS